MKIVRDYTDPETGIRCIEDELGNRHVFPSKLTAENTGAGLGDIHIHIPEIKVPPAGVKVEVTPPVDDPEKKRLLNVVEALRMENNWLWNVMMTAIIDRKTHGAPKAMDDLEKKIKERQRA